MVLAHVLVVGNFQLAIISDPGIFSYLCSIPMAQRLAAAFNLLTAKEELTNLASYTLFLDYGLC